MAYNTKEIVRDKDGNPVAQYFNRDTDQYEPVHGAGGGNAVILYNEDGTENNSLSLVPILDKLSQLTGTVIDEETRKSNELQRIALYNQISQMLADGELKGDKGDIGLGLEFDWQGTSLGVKVDGDTDFVYVDLRGPQGEQGPSGTIENLDKTHIEDALGYVPADEDIIGQLANLTTDEKANLVQAINEVKSQSNQIATKQDEHQVESVQQVGGVHGLKIERFAGSSLEYLNGWEERTPIQLKKIDKTAFVQFDLGGGVLTKGTKIVKLPTTFIPVGSLDVNFICIGMSNAQYVKNQIFKITWDGYLAIGNHEDLVKTYEYIGSLVYETNN